MGRIFCRCLEDCDLTTPTVDAIRRSGNNKDVDAVQAFIVAKNGYRQQLLPEELSAIINDKVKEYSAVVCSI